MSEVALIMNTNSLGRHSVLLKLAVLAMLASGIMSAEVVTTFDDLSTHLSFSSETNAYGYIPTSYDGFTWINWEVMNQSVYDNLYLDGTPIPSGPNFAFPSPHKSTVSISSTTPFVFVGAELSGWPDTNGPVASSVTIKGYLDDDLVGSATEAISNDVWSYSSGISGKVDKLVFSSGDAYFRMDNFEASAAPEPTTLGLVATGLLTLAFIRIRRRYKETGRN